MHLIQQIYVAAFYPALLLTAAYAWYKGGPAEQTVTVTLITLTVIELAIRLIYIPVRGEPAWLSLVLIDGCFFAVLLATAIRYRSTWIIVASALAFLTLFGHLGKTLYPNASGLAYGLMIGSAGYPYLICLAIGTAFKTRESQSL